MSGSMMSQSGYPKYLKLPDGTVVAAFNLEQLEAIQRVLIIWEALEFENYKLERANKELTEQVELKQEVIDEKATQIAKLEAEVRISQGVSDQYKALYNEQKAETQKWSVMYNKEVVKKKRWRTIGIVATLAAGVQTAILVLSR